MKRSQGSSLSPAVREVLECWDEQLLSVWLEAQSGGEWQARGAGGAVWPVPAGKAS